MYHARLQAHDHFELLEREDQPYREPLAGLARGHHAFHAKTAQRPVVDLIADAVDLDLDRNLEPDMLAMHLGLVDDLGLHARPHGSGGKLRNRLLSATAAISVPIAKRCR
jgi:hypothetical protein